MRDGAEGSAAERGGEETELPADGHLEPLPTPVDGAEEGRNPLEEELEALNDRHLRLAAEFDNYRKRMREELAEAGTRAQAELVRKLLGPLDDLHRVARLEPGNATVEAIVEGVDMVQGNLLRALKELGFQVLDPEGERFDPEVMEAVAKVPTSSPEDDDRVHQVFQLGYVFRGHLVRPARVAVRKLD